MPKLTNKKRLHRILTRASNELTQLAKEGYAVDRVEIVPIMYGQSGYPGYRWVYGKAWEKEDLKQLKTVGLL